MALLDKFFSTKRKLDYVDRGSRNWARSREITSEQVRLLLFKECDWKGRKVLFDSSTIEKIPAVKNDKPNLKQNDEAPCIVEVADGYSYVYKGPATDAKVLGDMIFGAVAVNYKSVSLKIHIMNDPKRFMCTKVFCVPSSQRISRVERKRSNANYNEARSPSKPLNVPALREEGVSLSFSIDRGDSGFYSQQSPYSSVGSTFDYYSMFEDGDGCSTHDELNFHSPPGRKLSVSSRGSWQRRTFQNLATRFDLGHSSNLLSVPTSASTVISSDSQVYSNSSTSGTCDSLLSGASSAVAPRKNKLGLALLITVPDSADMDFIRRCVEHSPQLQALVCRLRLATLAAGTGGNFVSTLHKAAGDAARWLSDLMYGPRLQSMWLNLVTSDPRDTNKQSESLLSDLCAVLAAGDTKHTNFFISTLLTNVLTHHLGWVTTVSPYDAIDPQSAQAKSVVTECRRPYNALWAQLGDLCGSIGFPPRAARTIIAGATNAQFINKLLAVLTYFVRCGEVTRTDYLYENSEYQESKVTSVKVPQSKGLNKSESKNSFNQFKSWENLNVPSVNTQCSGSSVNTLVSSNVSLKRSATLSNLNDKLSISSDPVGCGDKSTSQLRRNPTILISLKESSDSSLNYSGSDSETERKVVFVLGDDDKLVGLKNKSNGGKSVKKSSKVNNEPATAVLQEECSVIAKENCDENKSCSFGSPSKCCRQTLQHSKPIKHSGFKFEFDKYPQIVTNYMKSKNLEILDRHYIGKPGNLKLDNFQFDPTIIPPIQEERCETCYKCQLMESLLQTPTNASEMEYMNDIPRHAEPQYAKETVVGEDEREMSPKSFVRKRKENTIIVNYKKNKESSFAGLNYRYREHAGNAKDAVEVKQVLEFPLPNICCRAHKGQLRSGFDASLLGGVTEHYIPDLILQGTISNPSNWETELRRDLDMTSYLNKTETLTKAVAIVGDINTWEVHVVGRDCGWGGLSPLVGGILDALPVMRHAKVPAYQCILYLEGKLRELCVLSKTLADLLMTTDFCDMATLTKSLNIDVNDVPLLLAVATTHTPQLATRYGISYR